MNMIFNESETIDDLQINNLKLIQKKDCFKFGIDSVLISDFADIKSGAKVIDLGTGSGIIPILLSAKTNASKITGVEIQSNLVEMATRSVKLNKLENIINIIEYDLKYLDVLYKNKEFDCIVTNPPYFKFGGGIINENNKKAISRHEIKCTLDDIIKVSSKLLKHNGTFSMVHRPDRLVDIMSTMRKHNIEPKKLRLVYSNINKQACLILISGNKYSRPELKVLPPLYVYNLDGSYSNEINKIYNRS